jgi:polysaccharide pyruvyl transferase WcaK-like protein
MTKLLIDAEDFGNRGFLAIVAGLTKCLRKYIPDVNIVVFSTEPKK